MEKRQLGKSMLRVSPLAFGGNVFGWTVDEKKAFQILDAFVAAGFDFIDTANSYSRWVPGNKGGESETVIGNWMKKRNNRERVVIATKVGSDMGQGYKDISRKHILAAVEDSLRRLQTDYIDLYQTHWDVETIPVEETLEGHAKLVKEGKVRWIGASNFTPERLKSSLAASKKNGYPRYESLQPIYNLYDRDAFEGSLERICLDEGLGVIGYYSLASGFLTGKYRSESDLTKSPRGNGIRKYMNERGFRILAALDSVADQYQSTPASIAIAWLLARPSVTAPIASATTLAQLEDLTKAAELKLSDEAVALLNFASR
ncbi:MAG TPA: aldo/keto reductase [Candidatus Kryptobacter bacterium]|nr:aldo/keto reductase [Candidatus Kryptobacter bacterium]